ncbi:MULTISPECIES: DUF4192 domain-containing protein [Micrococcaceae]|uniref:DUF4192 domain-containing protein n=1 Tax=Arthrobacter rhombi TaxID=71253 RepID=A0A1R4GNT1_9MICC|nr:MULTISPECIES: DUF4192 domain-containing protein [Micrococcaceae]PCC26251.1 DUF4192 domain-containing protein [Glutamicibacter sp. BW78]SJM69773.1 conserved hypothetical protein [Arthrobacter rhombi]
MNSSPGQLSVSDAEGVISLVPHLLGFHPRESLVVLIMREKALEATLRVDLPAPGTGLMGARRFTRQLVDYLRAAPEADGACLVLYSELAHAEGHLLPYRDFTDAVTSQLQRCGYQVPDAWLVGCGRWWSYFCGGPTCCPTSGRPIESVLLSEAHLNMVLRGSSPMAEPWDGTGAETWPGVEAVREVVDEHQRAGGGWRESIRGLERWCAALDQEPQELVTKLRSNPSDTGALLASLRTDLVRDALPFAAGSSGAGARSALVGRLRNADANAELRELGEFMLGNSDQAPHWGTLEKLWEVGRGILPAARGRDRCALLCILGWVEWAKGHSSGAHALIATCRSEAPEYRLAALLGAFLARGRLPRWATNRETAWAGSLEPGQ